MNAKAAAHAAHRVNALWFGWLAVIAGIGMLFGANFANSQVSHQLAQERITMPQVAAMANLPKDAVAALTPYAGQPMTTGAQAKVYADYYIWNHMMAASGGKSYAEVSAAQSAASNANPNSADAQKLSALKQTMFMGDSLRTSLLTAYAFSVFGTLAFIGAWVALVVGLALLALGYVVLQPKAASTTV